MARLTAICPNKRLAFDRYKYVVVVVGNVMLDLRRYRCRSEVYEHFAVRSDVGADARYYQVPTIACIPNVRMYK